MGDYAESTYFGPLQGPAGVWSGVNHTASGFGFWIPGAGAPLALIDPAAKGGSSRWLAKPTSFTLIMAAGPGTALPLTSPLRVWRPVAPVGYSCLGSVITAGVAPPSVDAVRVLHNECVAECPARQLWCNAQLPNGSCATFNPAVAATRGALNGWSLAAYTSGTDGHGSASNRSGVLPTNLLWMERGGKLRQTVPCVKTACMEEPA